MFTEKFRLTFGPVTGGALRWQYDVEINPRFLRDGKELEYLVMITTIQRDIIYCEDGIATKVVAIEWQNPAGVYERRRYPLPPSPPDMTAPSSEIPPHNLFRCWPDDA